MGMQNVIINDRIDGTRKGFLALTVTCARCHDHKFDPIPQKDYYSLRGIFDSCLEPRIEPVIARIRETPAYVDYARERGQLAKEVQLEASLPRLRKNGDREAIRGPSTTCRKPCTPSRNWNSPMPPRRRGRWFWKTWPRGTIRPCSSGVKPAIAAKWRRAVFCKCCPGRCGRFTPMAAAGWNWPWRSPARTIRSRRAS